jgi:hypothetical protein
VVSFPHFASLSLGGLYFRLIPHLPPGFASKPYPVHHPSYLVYTIITIPPGSFLSFNFPFFHTLPLVARSNTLFSHPSLSLFSRTFTLLVALNCAFVFWLLLFFIIPFSCFCCPSPAGPVHGRIDKCLTTESSPTRPLYAMSLLQYQHCPDPAISSITKL